MTEMEFKKGKIHDVVVKPLNKYLDERGWLAELFRSDEVEQGTYASNGLYLHDPTRCCPWAP